MKKILLPIACCFFMQMINAQNFTNKFDAMMSEMFEESGPGAVALVMKKDKILYHKAFGMANLELGIKMKPENVFRIGSITKQFTASAILKLRDEGKLDLDDVITKYIEDYPTYGDEITLKHLLTHTSGVKNYSTMQAWNSEIRKKDFSTDGFIDFFKNEPVDFKPGERMLFNSSTYILLGRIIEIVSGMSYHDFIDSNFFKPLGMKSSYQASTSRIITSRASGYDIRNDEFINSEFISMTQPFAAGSLLSTVDDMFKWYDAVMGNKVISNKSRLEAQTTYVLNNGTKTGYGYGWVLENIQGSPIILHGGNLNGYATMSLYVPSEKVFVAVFSNCSCYSLREFSTKMAAVAIGKPYEWKEVQLDEDILKEYQGVYELDTGEQRFITYRNGQVFSRRPAGFRYELQPFDKDRFFFEDGDTMTFEFVRGTKGEVISVISKTTGYDVSWKKTSKPIPVIPKIEKIHLEDFRAEQYIGKYKLYPGFFVLITKENDKIFAQVTGQKKIEIIPFEVNRFAIIDTDIKLSFNIDDNGKVRSLTLHQGGDYLAEKIENQ